MKCEAAHAQITLDATPELQNKHTIFGRVAGTTVYNVLALAEAELSATQPDRPVYAPKLHSVEVIHNPFPDAAPRITREERRQQQEAKERAMARQHEPERDRKKKKKNVSLLSFGDDEEAAAGPGIGRRKGISSHDLLSDKKLSKVAIERQTAREPAAAPERPASETRTPKSHDGSAPTEQTGGSSEDTDTVRSLQDSIKRTAQGASGSATRRTKESAGRDLLRSMTEQYKKKDDAHRNGHRERATLQLLDNFRKRAAADRDYILPHRASSARDASEHEAEEDMREYGASDSDDDESSDWRTHKYVRGRVIPLTCRFDSGGVPLTGRADTFTAQDYEVLDSRDTRSGAAASLGYGGAAAVMQQSRQEGERRVRHEGRRGRDWVDR